MSTIHSEEETNLNLDGSGFFFLFPFFFLGGGEVEESLLMDDPFIENHLFCFIKALVFIFSALI